MSTAPIDALFHAMAAAGASDLHLSVASPPIIRKDGRLQPLDPAAPPLAISDLGTLLKPIMPETAGGGSPDSAAIRAARANIRQHMKYTNWLAGTRHWLAGNKVTYADLAAAATLSVLDYLGEVDWREHAAAREWYTRVKSRPSFRPLLSDRVRGLSPVSHYADLDF